MEVIVLEDKKNKFTFELDGMNSTFINALKRELWDDKAVKVATFSIRHPIVSKPKVIVETDGSTSPRQAISAAVSRVKKTNDKIRKEAAKELK